MAEDKIKQIMINGRLVGIVGLDDAIKKISLQANSDEEIKNSLLKDISINNYVPPSALDSYGNALLREFKIAEGILVAEETVRGLNIEVVGMGCARCGQLENDVRDLLSEMKIAASLRHITDVKEIARYKLLGSPALVINNKVVSVGDVPPKSKIRQLIIEAYKPINNF
ncbi:MAG: thioredoxin family protein [Deltaproteobacteria bacterium]|nr:thioredoxin family protein [Deltaproteobacteria bacterium]